MDEILPVLIVAAIITFLAITLFLILGLQPITRAIIKATGKRARARILGVKIGRWAVYSGNSYNRNITSQQVSLQLEVHPVDALSYVCEDKFMAKARDLMLLNEGCDIQVVISNSNPMKVVCLPETVTAGADSPVSARAGLAMADLIDQASHGEVPNPGQVLDALRKQGVQTSGFTVQSAQPADPKAALTSLKEMLDAGLITQTEFDSKKKDILGRM